MLTCNQYACVAVHIVNDFSFRFLKTKCIPQRPPGPPMSSVKHPVLTFYMIVAFNLEAAKV